MNTPKQRLRGRSDLLTHIDDPQDSLTFKSPGGATMSHLDLSTYNAAKKRFWDRYAEQGSGLLTDWETMESEKRRLHLNTPEDKEREFSQIAERLRNFYLYYGWVCYVPEWFRDIADIDTCWAALGLMERRGLLTSRVLPFSERLDEQGVPTGEFIGVFVLTDEYKKLWSAEYERAAEWRRILRLRGWAKFRHNVSVWWSRLKQVRLRSPFYTPTE